MNWLLQRDNRDASAYRRVSKPLRAEARRVEDLVRQLVIAADGSPREYKVI